MGKTHDGIAGFGMELPVGPKPYHFRLVTSTRRLRDLFRLRLWIRCLDCDEHHGPFKTRAEANAKLTSLGVEK